MPKLVYRVVSACAALGYGYPRASLDAALQGRVDAIVCDAGSMDAGPYYLGTGTGYFEREAVKADYRPMVEAGKRLGCPVILGSSGMAGGNRNLDWMLGIAKEIFDELDVRNAKVAVIGAELDPKIAIEEFRKGALRPTGAGPELSEEALRESTIVGQMGIHPIITALEGGAQYILAGRCCDVALFAADMIRRGIDAGLAYHVGHVLECGALACDPGSPSDCLVAEVHDDGSALFIAPNARRRCTATSIAAHALYQESHPQLQHYPEGVLVMDKTQFFSRGAGTGVRNSRLVRANHLWPLSIKLEGARRLGARKVSLIHIDPRDLPDIPPDALVYGRNGVQATPVDAPQRELGIIIETRAADKDAAVLLASLLTHHLSHYGYPGRKATTGNIAYPLSPHVVSFRREDGSYGAIVPSGTRDPVFLENYSKIKAAVIKLIENEFPDALANASYTITDADALNPAILLRTVDHDPERLAALHAQEIERITKLATPKASSLMNLDAPDAYVWSLYHLLQNEDVIKNEMFPIAYYRANRAAWNFEAAARPIYFDIGESGDSANLDDRTLSLIAHVPPTGHFLGEQRLRDMAVVIRSKNAGINRLTFDIIFNSGESYEAALCSNVFSKCNVAKLLDLPPARVVGTFFVDTCNAIKISIDRPNISGSMDERDVFGAQQQAAIEGLGIPIHAAALAKASAFGA
jgi:Domain of unknown function (DUF4387)/Acyclic terpene utilisation family protein AtuA